MPIIQKLCSASGRKLRKNRDSDADRYLATICKGYKHATPAFRRSENKKLERMAKRNKLVRQAQGLRLMMN